MKQNQNQKKRMYRGSDINMLTACDVMADHGVENTATLEQSNPEWNRAFFMEIKARILAILTSVFGISSVKDLKAATLELVTLQAGLLKHLTLLKKQIDSKYKDNPLRLKEILALLGYTDHWNRAKRDNVQTALISLLEVFEKGCTDELVAELTGKKISGVSIEYVRNNFRRMYEINVLQEGLKDSRKVITGDTVDQFNGIYNDTMFYAGSAQIIFSKDTVRKQQFTYTHILKQLGGSRGNPPKGEKDEE